MIAIFVCIFLHTSIVAAFLPLAAVSNNINSRCTRTLMYSAQPPAISLENLSCTHNGGETWQLKDVSYVLARSGKIALVGRNGTGKSTLLRIIAENTCMDRNFNTADMGMKYDGVVTAPRDVRVAYVEQEPIISESLTVADALLGMRGWGEDLTGSRSVFSVVRRYTDAVTRADKDPEAFAKASTEMDSLDGWSVLTKAEEIADKLRVRHLKEKTLSTLSGGERKRVALAAALAQDPDVLLLDEPTNFLSLAGVQWLRDLLVDNKKLTVLMVTHDRAFLDEVCDRILELDRGQLYEYSGSYADYLKGKEERLALEDAAVQNARAKYRVELDWMRRQPQARETKAKARIEAFYKLEKATKPRARDPSLSIENDGSRRLGSKILSVRGVSLKFGDRVMLNDFSYDFCKGDRICLAGANGVGKTTFIRVITGQQRLDSGTVEVGDTIVMGIYDQEGIKIEAPEQTVLEFVLERVQSKKGGVISEAPGEARRLLQKFEFPRQRWNERVSILSGGERRRLQMLAVLTMQPNFLIMDEPSVDCDIDTLQALESYLQEFDGVLLIVSHDRAFADKVSDHLFVFEGNGEVKDFPGSLSEYARTLVEIENENIKGSSATDGTTLPSTKDSYKDEKNKRNEQRNFARQAKKDLDKVEKLLEKLKNKAETVQREIETTSSDEGWSVLADLTDKLNILNAEIEEKEMEWIEIAEQLESIETIA